MNKEEKRIIKRLLSKETKIEVPSDMIHRIINASIVEQKKVDSTNPIIPIWVWWSLGLGLSMLLYHYLSNPINFSETFQLSLIARRISEYLSMGINNLNIIVSTSLMGLLIMILFNVYLLNSRIKMISV